MLCTNAFRREITEEHRTAITPQQHHSITTTTSTIPIHPRHPDISFWRQRIQEWYPRWRQRTYFIPPVLMCKTLADTTQIGGQNVLIPRPPVTGPTQRKSPPSLLASDVIEDQTQQRVLHCVHKLSRVNDDVMVVLSQLRYEDYLNQAGFEEACEALPRPVDLESRGKHRGDFDILILHRYYGILVCEVKSIGAQFCSGEGFSEQQKEQMLAGRLVNAGKQLQKCDEVLKHLVSDLPQRPRVRCSLILPNIPAEMLSRVLMKYPQISQTLCQCLGVESVRDITDLCLTSDRVSHMTTPHDINDDVIGQLRQWWQARMTSEGLDGAMSDSVYLELLARFCGPATTVRIFCALKPRLYLDLVRTEGEGAAETGRRFSQIMLMPHQLALVNSPEPLVVLTGPPGTGKSLTLVLKALQWLREGRDVHVLSTWHQSRAMSCSIVHQLEETLGGGGGGEAEGRVHLHELDLLKGVAEVDRGVEALLEACCCEERSGGGGTRGEQRALCVVADEAFDGLGGLFEALCHKLLLLLPSPNHHHHLLYFWAACMHHDRLPSILMEFPLTHPLRSPPSVTREVQRSASMQARGTVYSYTPGPCPPPADGLPTMYLWHSGSDHHAQEIRHCVQCGRNVAALLMRDLHVGVRVPGRCSQSGHQHPDHPHTPLHFGDVFLLSYYALSDSNGIVQGLRQAGVPVTVLSFGDPATTARVARAQVDEVVVAHLSFVSGLERKVVVWLQGERFLGDGEGEEGQGEGQGEGQVYDEQYGRLYAMSRCTAQLVCVMLPRVDHCADTEI